MSISVVDRLPQATLVKATPDGPQPGLKPVDGILFFAIAVD